MSNIIWTYDSKNPPPFAHVQQTLSVMVANHLCHYCLKPPSSGARFSRCSACKRAEYCSAECQKRDWQLLHKQLCKSWQIVNCQTREFVHKSSTMDRHARMCSSLMRHELAERMPQPIKSGLEEEIKCTVCLKTPWETDKYAAMKYTCEGCQLAWWCSDECYAARPAFHSPEICVEFRERTAQEHVQIAYATSRRTVNPIAFPTDSPRSLFLPVSLLNGWNHYDRLDPGLQTKVAACAKEFEGIHPDVESAVCAYALEAASHHMTVLSALEDSYPDLQRRKSLSIHFIGAGSREATVSCMMEDILHFLPSLQTLHVAYVGPRMFRTSLASGCPDPNKNIACADCKTKGRLRTERYSCDLYHRFAGGRENLKPADIFVMINSGCSEVEVESWKPTLDFVLSSGKPLLMTQFTKQEAQKEWRYLKMGWKKFTVVKPSAENKWHGVIRLGSKDAGIDLETGERMTGRSSYYRCIVHGRV